MFESSVILEGYQTKQSNRSSVILEGYQTRRRVQDRQQKFESSVILEGYQTDINCNQLQSIV